MPGRIKAGEGTLIGNAGEYYVMAELLKRSVIAALAPRNTPAFDILASSKNKTVRIRVKTKSADYDIWQYSRKKDGSIFRDLQPDGDFTVLVNLAPEIKDMDYFILPTHILNQWLENDFKVWLDAPGKNGQQHAAENPKIVLLRKKHEKDLAIYRNNWDILWK